MKYKSLVSVIIPIYNTEKYLRECVTSVINQTYRNIEIILVNDGSKDNSDIICKEFQKQYNDIKYIYQANSGVSYARNVGLEIATGDYVYFLDSDDAISDTFIETSVDIAIRNNSDIVVVGLNTMPHKEIPNCDYTWLSTCGMFLKKSFLDKYSEIRFPINIKIGEDAIFSHQLLLLTKNISINNNAFYKYRYHNNQSMSCAYSDTEFYLSNIKKWLDYLESFYLEYRLIDSREYQISLFIAFACSPYWNINLSKNKKIEYFNLIHDFINKYNLKHFRTYHFTLSNYMANKFIKCYSCQSFEKYLYLIKIFKFFKRMLNLR